jgi:hypothetical protein
LKENKIEKIFTREALLKSKRFSYVQKDFLKAILVKDSYTIAEAEAEVKKVFGGDK